ncbi:condensation domain-containing protein [Kytococcus sp. Marseille-QA3725]
MILDDFLSTVADVVGVPIPSANDTFLDIGGSSLDAIRILARFEQEHGIRIDPTDFFDCEQLGDVAQFLTEPTGAPETDWLTAAALDYVPATHAQQWALSSERLDPDAPALQFQVAFRLTGELDLAALKTALADVQHHHDALGVRFVHEDDEYIMERTNCSPSLEVETLPLTDDEPDAPWRAHLDNFARTPFPADGNKRWRTLVIRHDPQLSTLCLAFDHRTADGWSLGVILEDLAVCYGSRRRGEKPEMVPASSWLEYAAQERANLPKALQRAAEHWRPRLPARYEDYPVEIPGRLNNPTLSHPRTIQHELPTEAAKALDRLGRTPFVVATTALARAVSVTSGSDEVRILTSSANRRHVGHERTVGWFATGIFPTYHLDPHGDWEADLNDIASESRAALSVGDVPAACVRRLLWPDAPAGFRQDTGIYLACNDGLAVPFQLSGLAAEPVDTPDRADSPGLHFFVERTQTAWTLTCYFHEGEYPSEAVEDLILAFFNQLTSLPNATKEKAQP